MGGGTWGVSPCPREGVQAPWESQAVLCGRENLGWAERGDGAAHRALAVRQQASVRRSHHAGHDLCGVPAGNRRLLPGDDQLVFGLWALPSSHGAPEERLLPDLGPGGRPWEARAMDGAKALVPPTMHAAASSGRRCVVQVSVPQK